ncbi:Ig-like domain-containing alpha-2-macroglobulin family protein [Candidatus Paracaedibacter symbiosus]|uniref:Ig-like domain-containing alpha-2-macroglobulin family protein n=1 Tax=Candidatus Paracaedibacter symbiosus TaxID=244582 RepID=UPI00068ADF2E|nr:Ig-like domain-containing alpha-2-macroglobulin family protein [Candidatus Paracaedibacter symbiosus]
MLSIKSFLVFVSLCLCVHAEEASESTQPLQVVRVTPEGENIPETGQIVIEFDRPMAKLGQIPTVAEIGVSITPELKGQWQWINEKTLVLNVQAENCLKKAEKYTVIIKPGVKALDGSFLEKEVKHEFTTKLPSLTSLDLRTWKSPTHPAIGVSFNMPVTRESIEAHLYFAIKDNSKGRVAVKATPDHPERDKEDQKTNLKEIRNWLIEPVEELNSHTHYELRIEPGIKAIEGSEEGRENEKKIYFTTFDTFKFIGFSCRLNNQSRQSEPILFTEKNPQKDDQRCNPQEQISLVFTSPVLRSIAKKNIDIKPDPTAGKKDTNVWGEWGNYSRLSYKATSDRNYNVVLPMGLKAATDYTFSVDGGEKSWWQRLYRSVQKRIGKTPDPGFVDEFGRPLASPFSVTIKLDDRKPNFVLPSRTVILEKQVDSDAPLYVNNLKSATFSYKSLTTSDVLDQQTKTYQIPEAKNIQYAIPFKIREMLNNKSGVIYGNITTDPEVANNEYDKEARIFFAEVTPYQVQIKIGHYNTVVWVTDMATGEVVKGAKVTIYPSTFDALGQPQDILSTGLTNDNGIALLDGSEKIDPKRQYAFVWRWTDPRLFVRIEKDDNMALLPVMNNFEIDTYRASGEKFWSNASAKYSHLSSWGTTAQGIYRAGDKVQYKIYVRNQDHDHYVAPPNGRYILEVKDPTYKTIYEIKDVAFNEFGATSGEFALAKNAAIGWYTFEMKAYMDDMVEDKFDPKTGQKIEPEPTCQLSPMQMLVSEFTPSPFKVTVDTNGEQFQPQQNLTVMIAAKLHAGGAYSEADTEIAVMLQAGVFASKNPAVENFFFGMINPRDQDLTIVRKSGRLDGKGEFELTQKLPDQPVFYGKLLIESKVKDDRGKSVAANKTVDYIGGDRLVGLRQKEWLFAAKKSAKIQVAVVDKSGNPAAGNVAITVEQKETTAAKVKSAGNVYKTDANTTWLPVEKASMKLEASPATYSFTPKQAGTYKITAKTADEKGRIHTCELEAYVTGEDFVLWGEENDRFLAVIPEKNEYDVGDTAKFLVKNPYPGAKALITIERLGVIDSFVQTLDSNSPVIEIPIKPDYIPNFYVSVNVMSPRVNSKPLELGELDLAKPAFRMGYAKVSVKNDYKKIKVTATADKDVYKPQEKVKVTLQADINHPRDQAEPMELAVVVVDDSVFDLISMGRKYYDPYAGFYREEGLDMRNYSLLNGLVGRMKFAKKGATPGGDGGGDLSMRNVFKFVTYWNPSLPVDDNGTATIEFEAPDNLTGWRIFAIAMTPTDRMGTGEATFKVNRPTEIRPVMPNQVAEGDRFEAGFSVMNRTDKTRNMKIEIVANEGTKTFDRTVTVEPFKRATIYTPIHMANVKSLTGGKIDFVVTAGDELDQDKLAYSVPVKQSQIIETKAFFGNMDQGSVKIPVSVPGNIYPDIGGVKIALSPSLISNISGIFTYMKNYPYSCWEQKISRAVIAASYPDLKRYLGKEAEWPDNADFVKEILEDAASFQASNGGMAYYKAHDEYVDPFLSAFTGVMFAWLKQQTFELPTLTEDRLVDYLQGLLKNDFVEDYYSPSMVATTRAIALEALSYRGKVVVVDLERFMPEVTKMNAYGKASFVRAAMNVRGAEAIADKIIHELLSHFNETATQITWGEDLNTSVSRILDTPLRETCSVLETFARFSQTENGKALIGDKAAKLAKTIVSARKGKTHFENTQENLYCGRALATYSKVFESTSPQMTVQVTKDGKEMGKAGFDGLTNPTVEIVAGFAETDPGKEINISLTEEGKGRLHYTASLTYAQKLDALKAINAGLEVRRDYSRLEDNKWVLLAPDTKLKRGDLIRVGLYVITPADRTFVVVNDPIPGCFEPVNKNLATSSIMDQRKLDDKPAEGSWWYEIKNWVDFNATRWAFYFMEMRQDSVRFYSDYLPKGNYYLSYVAQVIADGEFGISPTTAEEMYNPETYGRFESTKISVASTHASALQETK